MLIVSIPTIRTEKPKRIEPISFFLSFLPHIYITIPTRASMGTNADGFNNLRIIFVLGIFVSDNIQLVTVVPIFAPIIMPITWCKLIMEEFTKPTAITVTALED